MDGLGVMGSCFGRFGDWFWYISEEMDGIKDIGWWIM